MEARALQKRKRNMNRSDSDIYIYIYLGLCLLGCRRLLFGCLLFRDTLLGRGFDRSLRYATRLGLTEDLGLINDSRSLLRGQSSLTAWGMRTTYSRG